MGYNLENGTITQSVPYGITVSRGQWSSLSGVDKFGYLPTATSSFRTIWEGDSIYTYISSPTVLTATSTSGATDENVEITISGLDTNYDTLDETVTLNASGTATTSASFIRVFRAFVANGQEIVGTVNITAGATTYAIINPDYQQTLMAVYTIPKGYYGYLVAGNISVEKDQPVVAKLMVRQFGGVLRSQGLITTFGVPFQRTWQLPPRLPEKTDIEIRAKAGATTSIAAGFEILLEKK